MKERRQILEKNMTEVEHRVMLSEVHKIKVRWRPIRSVCVMGIGMFRESMAVEKQSVNNLQKYYQCYGHVTTK